MINKDLNKYPANFFSEDEIKALSSIIVMNNYLIVKPLPVTSSKTNIVMVHQKENGKLEDKKSTKGVVVGINDNVAKELNLKVGDIIAWSVNAMFPKLVEVEMETYLALIPNEVFYKI